MPTTLAQLTTLRVGGSIGQLESASTEAQIIEMVQRADDASQPLLLLGGGSNVLVGDQGWPDLVLLIRSRGISVIEDNADTVLVEVAAGHRWDEFVATAVASGWSGIECLSGIPGMVGATPIQNVGAYGQDVGQVIEQVRALDRVTGTVRDFTRSHCEFGYRDSVFKALPDRFVVLAVQFRLHKSARSAPIRYPELARRLEIWVGDTAVMSATRTAVLELRIGKGMVLEEKDQDTWSAGSFFTNPIVDEQVAEGLPEAPRYPAKRGVKLSAAWLIEHAGFAKGYGNERASLSTKHTLALTNRGTATAQDLLALAREIRDGVQAKFQLELVPELTLINCKL